MSSDLNCSYERWDRTFLKFSSTMAEPFCKIWHLFRYRFIAPLEPRKFENCTTLANEIGVRSLIGFSGILGLYLASAMPVPILSSVVFLGAGSRIFRALGFSLQKGDYTYVKGEVSERALNLEDLQFKFMTWNICGVGGGLSLDHGGVIHWRARLEAMIQRIQEEAPDVLILQEVYDTALGEALIEKLKDRYAHFYMHLGPNLWGSVGGCMVISKCAVHHFSHTSFTNNDWTLNRGFADLEIKAKATDRVPSVRIIGTHLIHGSDEEDQRKRMVQVAQIVSHVAKQKLVVPTLLAGDLNIERDQEGAAILSGFKHAYEGFEPTCTNRLVAQWNREAPNLPNETIDYLSHFKNTPNVRFEQCHLVRAFDGSYNTKSALSDHHGISAIVKIRKLR